MDSKMMSYDYSPESQSDLAVESTGNGKLLLLPFWELTKPRLSLLTVFTAIAGYLAALPEPNAVILISLILGTTLAAGGAATLNQWMERESDAKMPRTRQRPLPSASISPKTALIYGLTLCLVGNVVLWLGVNGLAASLVLITELTYLLVYTPLKKRTPWSTEIGAISGAIPPLIGWAAAEGGISTLGWILFTILLFWQIPHFMAIAWIYRDEYAAAGFSLRSVGDSSGRNLSRYAFVFTVLLLISSLLPTALGYTTLFYGFVALLAGAFILYQASFFLLCQDRQAIAPKLFFASIVHLPFLLTALVFDRLVLG